MNIRSKLVCLTCHSNENAYLSFFSVAEINPFLLRCIHIYNKLDYMHSTMNKTNWNY